MSGHKTRGGVGSIIRIPTSGGHTRMGGLARKEVSGEATPILEGNVSLETNQFSLPKAR